LTNKIEVPKKNEEKGIRKRVIDYSIKEEELLPLFSFVPELLYCVTHLKFWTIQYKYDELKVLLSKRSINLEFYKKELDKYTTIDDIVKIYANDPDTLNELLKRFIVIFNAATVLQLKIKPFDEEMALDLSKYSSLAKSMLERLEK